MRRSRTVILGAVCMLLGFGIGAWLSATQGWGSATVATTVTNASSVAITRAYVNFESCNLRGTAIVGPMEPGHKRTVHFSLCGEGSYVVEVQLADGRLLHGSGGYVEHGYRTEEIVHADRIASSQSIR